MNKIIISFLAIFASIAPLYARIDNSFHPFTPSDLDAEGLPFRLSVLPTVAGQVTVFFEAKSGPTEHVTHFALVVMTKPTGQIDFRREYFERKFRDVKIHPLDSISQSKVSYTFIVVDSDVDSKAWKNGEWNLENHYFAPMSAFVAP